MSQAPSTIGELRRAEYRVLPVRTELRRNLIHKLSNHEELFGGIRGPEATFHWHSDTWELPPGAELLAWSQACRNQAFRAGRNIYGMQFHLEVTAAMIADWQMQDENCGDVRELPTPIDPVSRSPRPPVSTGYLSTKSFARRWAAATDRVAPLNPLSKLSSVQCS